MNNLPAIASQRGLDEATWNALTNSVFPGAKEESIVLAVDYCRARKLDVMKKPCHIVPMKVKDQQTGETSWRDVIMPGIYEQRTTAFKTGQMAGQDEPVFGDLIMHKGVQAPEWCRVTVYRFIGGHRCAFTHTEYFVEACATTGSGEINSMWRKRPRGQLAKCAEAGALRKAFPDELGGVMTAEEMQDSVERIESVQQPPKPAQAAVMASADQIRMINDLLTATQKDAKPMLAYFGVQTVEALTEDQAQAAIRKLQTIFAEQQGVEDDDGEIAV